MNTFKLALIGGFALGAAIASTPAHAGVDPFGGLTFTSFSGTARLDSENTLTATSAVTIPSGSASFMGFTFPNFFMNSANKINYQGTDYDLTLLVDPTPGGSDVTLSTYDVSPTTGSMTVTIGTTNNGLLTFKYITEYSSYSVTDTGATLTPAFNGSLVSDTSSYLNVGAPSDLIFVFGQATVGNGTISYSATLDVPETYTPSNAPEPISLSLLGSGLIGLGIVRRRHG